MNIIELPISVLIICIAFVIFYFSGLSLNLQQKKKDTLGRLSNFETIVRGFLIIIGLYACIITCFKSILLPAVIFLFLFKFWRIDQYFKKEVQFQSISLVSVFLFLAIASAMYLFYYWLPFAIGKDNMITFPTGDNSFYSRASFYMYKTGVENVELNYYKVNMNPAPYHYWDLWFTSLVAQISGLNYNKALLYVVYPFFCALFSLGVFEFYKIKFQSITKLVWVIALFSALFAGFRFLEILPYYRNAYILSPTVSTKTIFIGIVILYILNLNERRRWNEMIVFVCIVGVGFVNMLPALGLMLSFILFIKNKISFKKLIPGICILIAVGMFFLLFYKDANTYTSKPEYNLSYIKKVISGIAGGIFQLSVLVPFFMLFLFWVFLTRIGNKRFQISEHVIILGSIIFSGIFMAAITWNLSIESVQFFYNVFIPSSALLIVNILLSSLQLRNRLSSIFSLILVGGMILLNYKYNFMLSKVERDDFSKIKNFLENNGKGVFVNDRQLSEFKDVYEKNTSFKLPNLWLSYIDQNYINYSLDIPFVEADSMPPLKQIEQKLISAAPFSVFLKNSMYREGKMQLDSLKIKFMETIRAKYLMLSPNETYPLFAKRLIIDSVILSNKWRIYLLSKN